MQTSISQNKRVEVKERDGYREKCFKDAYDLDCIIKCKNVNDENWDWIENELVFKFRGNAYILKEIFKEGKDNSTDHVILEYLGSAGIVHTERFERHITAEKRMVSLMRGEDGNAK